LKWFQRAKTTNILEGDNNTRYFQMVANGKRRKTRIFRLEQEEGVIEGEMALKDYITNYYKDLFGASQENDFTLNESMVEGIPQLTISERVELMAEFTEKEVRAAIFQLKHNKAPGPDGFPAEFYQIFWSLIKDDLMAMFRDFHSGNLPLFCLTLELSRSFQRRRRPKRSSNIGRFVCSILVSRSLQK
jgi:hypothetical protein